jgi:hypothetical protein
MEVTEAAKKTYIPGLPVWAGSGCPYCKYIALEDELVGATAAGNIKVRRNPAHPGGDHGGRPQSSLIEASSPASVCFAIPGDASILRLMSQNRG